VVNITFYGYEQDGKYSIKYVEAKVFCIKEADSKYTRGRAFSTKESKASKCKIGRLVSTKKREDSK
jgi:hypothetical protein